jgi:hypothetical protein
MIGAAALTDFLYRQRFSPTADWPYHAVELSRASRYFIGARMRRATHLSFLLAEERMHESFAWPIKIKLQRI